MVDSLLLDHLVRDLGGTAPMTEQYSACFHTSTSFLLRYKALHLDLLDVVVANLHSVESESVF